MKYLARPPAEPPGARPETSTPEAGRSSRRPPGPPAASLRPDDCFYYLISRTTLMATAVLSRALAAAGVPDVRPAYVGALMVLWNEDDLTAAELARLAGLEPSSLTGLLDRMARAGLIDRHPDPHDRRALRIRLTAHGCACEPAVRGVIEDTIGRASQGISELDIERAMGVLRQVLENLDLERRRGA